MIAVLLLREVDQAELEGAEHVFSPEDVLHAAVELHQMHEYRQLAPRVRERVGIDVRLPTWDSLSATAQWRFWHRAAEAISEAESRRTRPTEVVTAAAQPSPGGTL